MAIRRMNEICTTMALTLVLSVLLFHTCQGQNETTVAASTVNQTTVMDKPNSTQDYTGGLSDPNTTNSINNSTIDANEAFDQHNAANQNVHSDNINTQAHPSLSTSETSTLQSIVPTDEVKSSTIMDNEAYQDNEQNNMQETQMAPQPDTSSTRQTPVFVPLLASGLILASVLLGLYVWKNYCHTKTSDIKLAEESYMSDKENQGNTLVSVSPLNPSEDQEKPSLNGESLEAVKTQNPPAATNGHSTANADTEL